ncbi:MAG: hypothetical protein RIF41_21225 [Polyangiaceae bacterium]
MSRVATVSATLAGATLAARRLMRPPAYLVVVVALSVSATSGLVERGASLLQAPDRALSVVLRLIVPLCAFVFGSLACDRERLTEATWPIARFGAPRGQVALGMTVVTGLFAGLVAAACSTAALAVAYGGGSGLGVDAVTSAWIAALGAAAYVGWFAFGGCFLRRGRGRWLVLVGDFTFGGTTGILAVMWPRCHLRSLAGGEAVLELAQSTSSVLLAAIATVMLILAAMRVGR